MANIILCIGKPGGPHTREVEKQVKSLDSAARLVHFYPLCGKHFIEITAGKISEHSPSCLVVVDGERIPAESIKSVCYRWGPELPSKDDDLQGEFFPFFNNGRCYTKKQVVICSNLLKINERQRLDKRSLFVYYISFRFSNKIIC